MVAMYGYETHEEKMHFHSHTRLGIIAVKN